MLSSWARGADKLKVKTVLWYLVDRRHFGVLRVCVARGALDYTGVKKFALSIPESWLDFQFGKTSEVVKIEK